MVKEETGERNGERPVSAGGVEPLTDGIRPSRLSDFVGQDSLREKLSIFIKATLERQEALDHVLFHGPPGLGKTTMAHIIAHELGASIRSTSGPVLERAGDLAAILTNLQPRDVLFIDEIHRMNRTVEEVLYPAMEDFQVDIIIGKGPSARSVKLSLQPFTLIGATTRIGLLSSPLRDRFGVEARLEFYIAEELTEILKRSAGILEIEITQDGAWEIARRSRGTPRVANRLLRRVRDFAQVRGSDSINRDVADTALEMMEVDEMGLDPMDREILRTIVEKFGGGPVGVNTLAVAVGEESDTVEEVYEPYLIQIGFIKRTHRGRVATNLAYRYLELPHEGEIGWFDEDSP